MIESVYKSFGFEFRACVSSRPEKYLGELELWNDAEQALKQALSQRSVPFSIDEGGGAFYGPKIGIEIEDSMGRWWQVATVQVDFNLPERFNLRYIDSHGESKRPVVIHMALYGAIERFMACLLEHSQGDLPLRLAPQQVRIYPVADRHGAYAERVRAALRKRGIRALLVDERDTLGARLREGRRFRAPYSVVVGDHECEKGLVSVSKRGEEAPEVLSLESFVERCERERLFSIQVECS
jgi:threonyl-tRNA synthetase